MDDKSQIEQRFELLKMARELLNEDYINRRAEDHNKWIAENDEMWRKSRRNVPYPAFAQYPTDEEIVRAASNLYNFIYSTPMQTPVHTPAPSAELVTPVVSASAPVVTIAEATITQAPVMEDMVGAPTLPQEPQQAEKPAETSKLLPGWMRRATS